MSADMLILLSQLVFSALAAFLAIMLWNNTRDPAWMFIVTGIILNYVEITYKLMKLLGLVKVYADESTAAVFMELIFINLPYLFYIAAFIIVIYRSRTK